MIRSSFIVSVLAAFGSGVSFLGQLILARFFGAGAELDAYLVAISLPLTVAGLLGGILGYQVVPALRREETAGGGADASLIAMLAGLGGSTAVLAAAGIAFTPAVMGVMAHGLPAASLPLVEHVSVIAWTWLPLAVIGAILTGGLHARHRFIFATLLQPLPAIGAMWGCLAGHQSRGVSSLAWGQLAGYLLMVALLATALRFRWQAPDWKQTRHIFREVPLALGALLVFVIYPLPDAIWGAQAGVAGVSLLGYAQRLIVGFAGLAVVGATTVLFPRLSQQAADGAHQALQDDLARSLRIMLACMAPAAAALGVLALPIVRFLFVRGAFGEPEAAALARLLPWMFGGMVAMSGMTLAFKALFALGRVRQAATFSLAGAGIYFVASALLVGPFGLSGIGAAYALVWWVVLALAIRALGAASAAQGAFIGRLILITAFCGIIAWMGREIFLTDECGRWTLAFALAGVVMAAVAAFLAASFLWPGLDEVRFLAQGLRNKKAAR